MTYLVDTHWLVSFLNGRIEAIELLGRLSSMGIAVSIVACGEVYEGFQGYPDTEPRLAEFDAFLQTIELITIDRPIARAYGRLRAELRATGQLIPDNDLWIAATALAFDLTLVSRDKHFERLPGLVLYRSGL